MDALMYGTNGEPLELQYDTARGKGVLRQPFEGLVNSIERRYRDNAEPEYARGVRAVPRRIPLPRLRREAP